LGAAGGGIGGLILLVVLALLGGSQILGGGGAGFDPGSVLRQLPQAPAATGDPPDPATDPDAGLVDFVSFVLDDVQGFWDGSFQTNGSAYRPAKLVLFTNATRSGCGDATSDVGPFYCSADETAYLDLDFFRELTSRFGAPGDFAQAYVIAHELGHHVQNLTGVSEDVNNEAQKHPDKQNELSVKQELQADCLAGVWAHSTYERGILENGDLEEGLAAAASVGDDRLQQQAGARVNPETWTHGSSEQRVHWFRQGYDSGDPGECDTF
jgi:predicted metalloprotease